ncbi:MAG: M24 family metallopeptidase, partial [Muribaculaceae bacterium]|nr:M24 family metallopeptidase [Muribaculaceae bacterium]
HRQHAGFIGHGVGIEINELPVIAPRSRDILQADNVIALEPKFVIPHVGAVGIENTYVVTADGLKCLTNAPEEIIGLE